MFLILHGSIIRKGFYKGYNYILTDVIDVDCVVDETDMSLIGSQNSSVSNPPFLLFSSKNFGSKK